MIVMHESQTTKDVLEEKRRRAEAEHVPGAAERGRLQVLVGELLSENQKLRFENEGLRAKSALLEQQARDAARGLKDATGWAGALF